MNLVSRHCTLTAKKLHQVAPASSSISRLTHPLQGQWTPGPPMGFRLSCTSPRKVWRLQDSPTTNLVGLVCNPINGITSQLSCLFNLFSISVTQRLDADSLFTEPYVGLRCPPNFHASHKSLIGATMIITVHLNPSAGVVSRNRSSLSCRDQQIYFHLAAFAQRTSKARSLFVQIIHIFCFCPLRSLWNHTFGGDSRT